MAHTLWFMKIRGVQHVAIAVTDVDEAVRFYTETLGCTVVAERPDFGLPGAWLRAGDQQVHLALAADPSPDNFQHFALEVDDLPAAIEEVRRTGWQVDPVPLMPGAGHQAFLRDPSGNLIELNQPE
jgi:catechol 2,3-dioxygenase-like lactoylglutathione lyase family enzyme